MHARFQGAAADLINEIGSAAELDDRNFAKDRIISMSKIVGQVDGNNVMSVSSGDQTVYFLIIDDQMASFIGFENGHLKNIKNFTKTLGVVRALVGYLVHIKKQPIKISKDEPLTPSGIKWLLHLISNPRGLNIKDTSGKPIDVDALNTEWLTARSTGKPGNTGIVISENLKFGEKLRLNENNRRAESILMPYNFYITTDVTEADTSELSSILRLSGLKK